ncbi:MAG: alcohol dehydrogenase catalytic domain-containing protein [Nannocystaceae bacterium]|nr:alcohol dehydrogenase catalytic domain-containing protein [Nannocystaceae bacterium]
MKALVHDEGLALVELAPPTCEAGEALIAVRLAGVCATDLEVLRGYRDYRGVMGHEMVGEVVECPDDPTWVGRRVAPEINVTCGHCHACRHGCANMCERRSVMGIFGRPGCFAELVALPIANLHVVPDSVDDLAAVFVEPLAAAYRISTQIDVAGLQSVAVLGDGKLGLLIAMAMAERGAPVVLYGRHERKLLLAEGAGIATRRSERGKPRSCDLVVEATGSASGLKDALELVRPRGTLVLKSTFQGAVNLNTNRIVVDEITVLGSRCGPFDVALDALARAAVDPRPLIDATYPLADGVAAIEHARSKGTLKVLLDMRAL